MVEGLVTAEELARMKIDEPCELVEGRIVWVPPASKAHGRRAWRIARALTEYVDSNPIGEVLSAETGFLVKRDPDTVRAPDVAFATNALVAEAEARPKAFFHKAPEFAVEVVSPDDRWSDLEEKAYEYLGAGGLLVWVVNPKTRTVTVYEPGPRVRVVREHEDLDGGAALPGFRAPVARLFEGIRG